MDKNEFITEILNLYSKGFYMGVSEAEGKKAKETWVKACNTILPKNVNYDKLWFQFLKVFDCKTINAIPSPQWLYKESQNFLISPTYVRKNFESDPIPDECRRMREYLQKKIEERAKQLKGEI